MKLKMIQPRELELCFVSIKDTDMGRTVTFPSGTTITVNNGVIEERQGLSGLPVGITPYTNEDDLMVLILDLVRHEGRIDITTERNQSILRMVGKLLDPKYPR